MRLLDLYYLAKPLIPQSARLWVRSALARRQRSRARNYWPIAPASAVAASCWKGWPDGKRFAFVLTHDVEGQRGHDRCRAVASLESELGFRSSFNFVPEGSYRVDPALRHWLRSQGFEIGVHDLHHDGSLYRSEAGFRAAAQQINRYLTDWNAVGFRSAFMLHNLEWLQQLDLLYDASTFDSDPFEPQPEAAGTIYPFLVKRSDGSSYVELPYTLVQDSTLFFVLREKTIDVWKRKLDWIREQGGMALVNVHPDYLALNNRKRSTEFPIRLYRELLDYVRGQYGNEAWCALPQDVARYVKQAQGASEPVAALAGAAQ